MRHSDVLEDAMAETMPMDSPARLSEGQAAHLGRVTREHVTLIQHKYQRGQIEHGGNCYEKPGMLAHAMDEAADLPVYLHTLAEQMRELVVALRGQQCTPEQAADEIERWMRK